MLKIIVQQSQSLVAFISALNLALCQPQKRHLIQLLDALLVSQGRKTLSDLYRLWIGKLDPKTAADFFRESPWGTAAVSGPRKRFMVKKLLAFARQLGFELVILISVDDSLGKKGKATRHLQAVDFLTITPKAGEGNRSTPTGMCTSKYMSRLVRSGVYSILVSTSEKGKFASSTGNEKRRSKISKNEHARHMLLAVYKNRIPFQYVLTDIWFASAENMCYVKLDLKKDFIMALKGNRKVAVSPEGKSQGQYQRIDQLEVPEGITQTIYLEGVPFPLHLARQIFINEDGSTGVGYLVTSDLTLDADQIITIYQKRWKVEAYHRSLKQNASLAKSPTRTETTQTNHFAAALWSFVKIELLKVQTNKNHYQLKAQLYFSALQVAFQELQMLKSKLAQQRLTA